MHPPIPGNPCSQTQKESVEWVYDNNLKGGWLSAAQMGSSVPWVVAASCPILCRSGSQSCLELYLLFVWYRWLQSKKTHRPQIQVEPKTRECVSAMFLHIQALEKVNLPAPSNRSRLLEWSTIDKCGLASFTACASVFCKVLTVSSYSLNTLFRKASLLSAAPMLRWSCSRWNERRRIRKHYDAFTKTYSRKSSRALKTSATLCCASFMLMIPQQR